MDPSWRIAWEEDVLSLLIASDPSVNNPKDSPFLLRYGNITNSSALPWRVFENTNSVYGMRPGLTEAFHHSDTPTARDCELVCRAHETCRVWTWHAPEAFGGYALQCWLRVDGIFDDHSEGAHVSGCRVDVDGCASKE